MSEVHVASAVGQYYNFVVYMLVFGKVISLLRFLILSVKIKYILLKLTVLHFKSNIRRTFDLITVPCAYSVGETHHAYIIILAFPYFCKSFCVLLVLFLK